MVLQAAANPQRSYLHNMVGEVIELCLPYKAVVAFQYKGKQERALLKADKVIVDGVNVPPVCLLSHPYYRLLTFSYSVNISLFSFFLADCFLQSVMEFL